MRKALLLAMAALMGIANLSAQTTTENIDWSKRYSNSINTGELKRLVTRLASNAFEGRESATDGQRKAANFIKRYYKNHDVAPGNGDVYLQEFEVKVRGISEGMSTNVLGFIEGEDKKDEILVLSAHYDHLGKNGKDIYHGADDDGSGTAAIMVIAKAFAKAKKEGHGPRRSILFLNFSGEEKGLLGSEYYTENPVYPLKKTIADLNVDMIGRLDSAHAGDTNYVYLIGSDKLSTQLDSISTAQNNLRTKLKLDYTFNSDSDPNRFYYRSDHYNFAKNGIPVIFYFSGVHADYHEPTDTADKILYDKMQTITKLVFFTAWELANMDNPPKVDKPIK